MQPNQFIIEGVDRMGKSTLIRGLLDKLGYHLVVHYDKPVTLTAYADSRDPLERYQRGVYQQMFRMIDRNDRVVFDRGHLGELVYARMYRKYDPNFAREFESFADTSRARLVLLTTSDFSFIQDDGLSIDFAKKEVEQLRFVHEFHRSAIADKVLVDVCDGRGGYKTPEAVLAEVLKK